MTYALVALAVALVAGGLAHFAVMRTIDRRVGELLTGLRSDSALSPSPGRRWSRLRSPRARSIDSSLVEVSRRYSDRYGSVAQAAKQSREVAVGLNRRMQTLLLRQLHAIEALESDPANQQLLPRLFALDHLAAMTQRVNVNSMVLAGVRPARQITTPMSTSDLLFAALSGIEQYQRVVVEPQTTVTLPGAVAHDLIQIVTELLDNALTFSQPDTVVRLYAHLAAGGGITLGVADTGVGMPPEIRDELNHYLAGTVTENCLGTRRVGLQVVRRLTERHGLSVRFLDDPHVAGTVVELLTPSAVLTGSGAVPQGGRERQGVPATSGSREVTEVAASDAPSRSPRHSRSTAPPATSSAGPGPVSEAPASSRDGRRTPDRKEGADVPSLPSRLPRREIGAHWHEPELLLRAPTRAAGSAPLPLGDASVPVTARTGTAARRWRRGGARRSNWFASRVGEQPTQWTSQADDGWKVVETAAEIEVPTDDASGLPMRTPGALLMPGSIAPSPVDRIMTPSDQEPGMQEPVVIRNRLSSYRDGVSRARLAGDIPDELATSGKWSLSRSG